MIAPGTTLSLVFPRSLPLDLGCSARYRLKQGLLSLFSAFCLAKGLHNSLIAFFFCSGRMCAPLTVCCGMFVPDLLHTLPLDHTVDTGLAPFQTHSISSEICYQQPSHTASITFYCQKRCIMNFYHLIYRQSVPQISRGRAMYSPTHCDTWSSH